MQEASEHSVKLLRESLAEAQVTVRAYDTKAQIVGVGYIFALNVIFAFDKSLPKSGNLDYLEIIIAWLVIISPIVLFGYVLHPSRRTAPKLGEKPAKALQRILYVDPAIHSHVGNLIEASRASDHEQELAYELLKVSGLREIKRERFLRALAAAAICFFVLFSSQLSRVILSD